MHSEAHFVKKLRLEEFPQVKTPWFSSYSRTSPFILIHHNMVDQNQNFWQKGRDQNSFLGSLSV